MRESEAQQTQRYERHCQEVTNEACLDDEQPQQEAYEGQNEEAVDNYKIELNQILYTKNFKYENKCSTSRNSKPINNIHLENGASKSQRFHYR